MVRIRPNGPMGRTELQNTFDVIEMHSHLPEVAPQLTFTGERRLLEEVMWLRQTIAHHLGWSLPVPSHFRPEFIEEEPPAPSEQWAFKDLPPDPKKPTFMRDHEHLERTVDMPTPQNLPGEEPQTSCGEVDASDHCGPDEVVIPFDQMEEVDILGSAPVTVGRIVHYRSYGTPKGEFPPECRAAIVTQVNQSSEYPQSVALAVLNPTGIFLNQYVDQWESYNPEYPGGTWHWRRTCQEHA